MPGQSVRPSDRAWIALTTGVVVYDVLAPPGGFKPRAKHVWAIITAIVLLYNSTAEDGDLLSEQVDSWLLKRPLLTRAVIAVFAAHLSNLITPRYDIVSLGFVVVRKARWRGQNAQSKIATSKHTDGAYVLSTGMKSSKAKGRCQRSSSFIDVFQIAAV